MNQSKIAALLAASFVLGTGSALLAQTGAGGKTVSPPSDTTGSGKDTGMNIQSGMSGNGPGGVGTAGAGTSVGGTTAGSTTGGTTAKTSGSMGKKKNAKHSKKKSHSSSTTSSNGSAATATQ